MLGGRGDFDELAFEAKYPVFDDAKHHPHLDVAITGQGGALAVESKYLEPYDEPKSRRLSRRYLDASDLWHGLPSLRQLAEVLLDGSAGFTRLDAVQLVKHSLGLARAYGSGGFLLLYVWYDIPGAPSDTHRRELDEFTELALRDFRFASTTYQHLHRQLRLLEEPIPGYQAYLKERYF